MTAKKLQAADISTLVEWYVEAAITHREAIEGGDPRKANKAHDIVAGVYRELRSRGESAQRTLLPLLKHDHLGVQLWAAAHALEFAPNEGVPVLESIAKRPIESIGMIGVFCRDDFRAMEEGRTKVSLDQYHRARDEKVRSAFRAAARVSAPAGRHVYRNVRSTIEAPLGAT